MERQTFKWLTTLSLAMMFTLFLAVGYASAGVNSRIRAKIPFDFIVGDKRLPAGEYTFGPASAAIDSGLELVRSVNTSASALRVAHNVIVSTARDKGAVVFHKYGDQYFLSQVWLSGETSGSEFAESSSERAIKRQLQAQLPQDNMSGRMSEPVTVDIVASLR
jgi:frataxin-like iron-binding protein CyaY